MSDITKKSFWIELLKKILRIIFNVSERPQKTDNQHVVPHDEGWAVRGGGNQRVTAIYKYQKEAIKRARQIAKKNKSSVIIHRSDGTIRERLNYDD